MRPPAFRKCHYLGLMAALLACGTALAQPALSTLDRIRRTQVLRIGYDGHEPPFDYIDANGKVTGYSIELCNRLADVLRAQLALPKLTVQYDQLSYGDRIDEVKNGAVDIECGTSTITAQRLATVAFAPSHFITQSRYASLAADSLRTIEDLHGKSVAAVRGTSNVSDIARLNRQNRLNLSIFIVSTNQAAFDLLTQGRVSAFPMDDVLLRMMIDASGQPERYAISRDTLAPPLRYGFMIRRGDPTFAHAVDAAMRRIYAGPDMQAIYDRWFDTPLPGLGVDLHLPMNPAMRFLFSEAKSGTQ
ncbi:amino acid ABC transporter substrate-binding protein [Bordetella sp. FB-8]|uniref:amino acid ABC transporter substrate-binding protein n=1 Tax=Bordetella sp. FB-8 TaxID=1159870 RepID=UPI00039BC905|nr:amino acid ABC transporter substrate-binding protein [Bordetella sp. FB-8]